MKRRGRGKGAQQTARSRPVPGREPPGEAPIAPARLGSIPGSIPCVPIVLSPPSFTRSEGAGGGAGRRGRGCGEAREREMALREERSAPAPAAGLREPRNHAETAGPVRSAEASDPPGAPKPALQDARDRRHRVARIAQDLRSVGGAPEPTPELGAQRTIPRGGRGQRPLRPAGPAWSASPSRSWPSRAARRWSAC